MTAFAVKHCVEEFDKYIFEILDDIKARPYSLTKQEYDPGELRGCYIYVIESIKESISKPMSYKLAYRYRAECFEPISYKTFKFKIMSKPIKPFDCCYFENSVEIIDSDFKNFWRDIRPLTELSWEQEQMLNSLIDNPKNKAIHI